MDHHHYTLLADATGETIRPPQKREKRERKDTTAKTEKRANIR